MKYLPFIMPVFLPLLVGCHQAESQNEHHAEQSVTEATSTAQAEQSVITDAKELQRALRRQYMRMVNTSVSVHIKETRVRSFPPDEEILVYDPPKVEYEADYKWISYLGNYRLETPEQVFTSNERMRCEWNKEHKSLKRKNRKNLDRTIPGRTYSPLFGDELGRKGESHPSMLLFGNGARNIFFVGEDKTSTVAQGEHKGKQVVIVNCEINRRLGWTSILKYYLDPAKDYMPVRLEYYVVGDNGSVGRFHNNWDYDLVQTSGDRPYWFPKKVVKTVHRTGLLSTINTYEFDMSTLEIKAYPPETFQIFRPSW